MDLNTMSKNNPIPIAYRDEFKAHMLKHDKPGSPAWRVLDLQDAASEFCINHDKLRFADTVKATAQYLRMVDPLTKQNDLPRMQSVD